jgi:hypothetical protein
VRDMGAAYTANYSNATGRQNFCRAARRALLLRQFE